MFRLDTEMSDQFTIPTFPERHGSALDQLSSAIGCISRMAQSTMATQQLDPAFRANLLHGLARVGAAFDRVDLVDATLRTTIADMHAQIDALRADLSDERRNHTQQIRISSELLRRLIRKSLLHRAKMVVAQAMGVTVEVGL